MDPREGQAGGAVTLVSSGAARSAPTGQVELFGLAVAANGLTTLSVPCHRCLSTVGVVAAGSGPHYARLTCTRPLDFVVAAAPAGAAMSDGVFNLIDREKLLSGAADYGASQVSAPPGVEANPVGLSYDGQVGRYLVRFLFVVDKDGAPHFASIWNPAKPKRLKPALIKKFRRERRHFSKAVAQEFGLALRIIDRMDGAPRVTELVYEHGAVEPVEPPVPFLETVVH
ncbi:MAG: hypothetical protein M3461_22455 [Pseudomonadota bacterium]|nr:hypothetical protein [Pseudomonadota bacterium]